MGIPKLSDLITIRHSRLRDYRQCPLKEHLGWDQGWEKVDTGGARQRGNIWHEMMAMHYNAIKRGCGRDEVEDLVYTLMEVEYPDYDKRDLLEWMYEGYLAEYGLDEDWEILEVERTLVVPFLDRAGQPTRFEYEWTGDLLVRVRSTNSVVAVDNKSVGNIMKQTDIDLDDQFGLYVMAWRRWGYPVEFPMFNGVRAERLVRPMTSKERFQRTPSYRTEIELLNIEQDALNTCWHMFPPDGIRRLYSSPIDPRKCNWSCDFKEAHIMMRKSKDPGRMVPAYLRKKGFQQGATHR